jgi:hypothetical protein
VFLQIAIYKALGQQDDHKVRGKTGSLRHLYIKRSFYQDRLGTNIRENSKKARFLEGYLLVVATARATGAGNAFLKS